KSTRCQRIGNHFFERLRAIHHHLAVELFECMAQTSNYRERGTVGPNVCAYRLSHQRRQLVRDLRDREIKLREYRGMGIFIEPPLLYVTDDTDDFGCRAEDFEVHALADRILVTKGEAGKLLVDHHYGGRALIVGGR